MSLFQNSKKVIYSFDLFCSSQLLRYRQETQYKTITGGIVSMVIITAITVGFASMILDTLNKATITSDLTKLKQSNPPPLTLVSNQENNFMFALAITSEDTAYSVNLTSTLRNFDISVKILSFQYGNISDITIVPFEVCTKQHWTMVADLYQNFDLRGGFYWLCLPIGYRIPLAGAYSSDFYSLAKIDLTICQNTSTDSSCAPQADIDNLIDTYGNFIFSFMYVNPVINPNQPDYISYYFEQNDYTLFSKTIGSQAWVQFSDFTINTDYSLLPFPNIVTNFGSIVQNKAFILPRSSINNLLATVILAKSDSSLIYNRQVQKISAVFSYIGGLVGAVTAFLLMFKFYTESSLQITIGLDLFDIEKQQQRKKFNLFQFACLIVYRLLRYFSWKGQWKTPENLRKYQEEAVKQMDVSILLRRLIMLETCMSTIFTKEQIQKIREAQEGGGINIHTAQRMRTFFVKNTRKETVHLKYFERRNPNKINNVDLLPKLHQSEQFDVISKNGQIQNNGGQSGILSKGIRDIGGLLGKKNPCVQFGPKNQIFEEIDEIESGGSIMKIEKLCGDTRKRLGNEQMKAQQSRQKIVLRDMRSLRSRQLNEKCNRGQINSRQTCK